MIVRKDVKYQQYEEVWLEVGRYGNGRIAIYLTHKSRGARAREVLAKCTVNLADQECYDGEVWVKSWAENEGMAEWLIENGITQQRPMAYATSGYVPVLRYKLAEKFIGELSACKDTE